RHRGLGRRCAGEWLHPVVVRPHGADAEQEPRCGMTHHWRYLYFPGSEWRMRTSRTTATTPVVKARPNPSVGARVWAAVGVWTVEPGPKAAEVTVLYESWVP